MMQKYKIVIIFVKFFGSGYKNYFKAKKF